MKIRKYIDDHLDALYMWGIIAIICFVDGQYFRINSFAVTDEFSIIATGAYYAGMDWSDVVANTTGWHGYGAVILLTPLFSVLKDGIMMYKLCQIECLIFRIVTAILCYFLVKDDMKLPSKYAFGVALICDLSNLSPDDGNALSALTEVPFNFLSVLIIFLSIKMINAQKKKGYTLSITIGFLLIYMLTVHSRGIVYIGVYMLTMLIISIKNHRFTLNYIIEWLTIAISYWIYKIINHIVITDVYTAAEMVSSVKNTAENTVNTGLVKIWRILTIREEFGAVLKTVLGLSGSFNAFSYGAVIAFSIVIITYYVNLIKKKERFDEQLFLIINVGLLGFWGMNISLAIKNAYNVANGVSYLAYTYMRYAYPFASVFLIGGIICAYHKKYSKHIILCWLIISILIMKYYMMIPIAELTTSRTYLNGGGFQYYNSITSDFYLFILGSFIVGAIATQLIKSCKFGTLMSIYIIIGLHYYYDCFSVYEDKANRVLDGTIPSAGYVNLIEDKFPDEVIYHTYVNSKKYPQMLRILCSESDLKYIPKEKVDSIDFSKSVLFVDDEYTAKNSGAIYTVEVNPGVWCCFNNENIFEAVDKE